MAIEYHCYIQRSPGAPQDGPSALQQLSALAGWQRHPTYSAGPGLSAYPREADDEDRITSQRKYGFSADLVVLFHQNKSIAPEQAARALVQALGVLLSGSGDAALEEGECVLLRRQNGQIKEVEVDDFWRPLLAKLQI